MESKIIVICGPTATGKSGLAIKLSKEFNGEIISADSRQIYREMNIGTGKDLGINSKFKSQNSKLQLISQKYDIGYYAIDGVKVWLYDLVDPSQRFSVAEYIPLAKSVIVDVISRSKQPFVVGGTGLYTDSLFKKAETFGIPPNIKLRAELETQPIEELVRRLGELNPEKLRLMNSSDRANPRRLIRAIEVALSCESASSKTPLPRRSSTLRLRLEEQAGRNDGAATAENILKPTYIGLTASLPCLYKRIDDRVDRMLEEGLLAEVEYLAKEYGWTAPGMDGIGYRQFQPYFTKEDSLENCVARAKFATHAYARRQLTWFKRNKNITWFEVGARDPSDALGINSATESVFQRLRASLNFDDRVSQLVQSNR